MLFFKSSIPLLLIFCLLSLMACKEEEPQGEVRVLVFSKTSGFRHESIGSGIAAIQKMGLENNFKVDTTENASKFTEDNLGQYNTVVFLNTTQDVLNNVQQREFERYIQAGGSFVGVHAAADTEYNWPWYNQLLGAYFNGHPNSPNVRKAVIDVLDPNHISTKHLPARWERNDEWYNYRSIQTDIQVLANLDEKTYQGGTNGENHPIAWYHEFDGGRAWYTGGGHTNESYTEPAFVQHLLGGILYAIGDKRKPDFSKATSMLVPEDNRFSKVVLDEKLNEPMELSVTEDGRVFYIERTGKVKLYDPQSDKTNVIGQINVFSKNNDGLLGITADPQFTTNHWLYLYYSPAGDIPKQHLSRFTLKDGKIDIASEKILLEIPTQRQECCHSAGSLTFDKKGNLYISTGDNTGVNATAYAPIDERPGRSAFDAQKSSANTNDLRGKILKIIPQPDGTYTIPEGNLFPQGTPKTRPEIYVMGNRNPFRISIDNKTGYLYWGDIGPDAGKDSTVGPQSYDEFNQARKPGNYGWPYFVGYNRAYPHLDFATNKIGELNNLQAPVNNSPNNTGLQTLPPVQLPLIWYPYGDSQEFPILGKGGRNAMAGQVYYSDEYKNSDRKFPDYYNGKLFIYEWMRNLILIVSMDKEGNFQEIEPFAPSLVVMKPMDMEFSPDGALYMLEYGSYWYTQNEDARLVRIEYNAGNRKPVVQLAADKTVGAVPLPVQFSAEGTFDRDGDSLTYQWSFAKPGEIQSTQPAPSFTFTEPGVYKVSLTVTDAGGQKSRVEKEIKVGNEPPQLLFQTNGNQSFYWDNEALTYEASVNDKEDGSTRDGSINQQNVLISFNYLPQGKDIDLLEQDFQASQSALQYAKGKGLIDQSDCKACHALDKKSIGPSYQQVAERYKNNEQALDVLSAKIINGGGGNWGEMNMSAHPQLTQNQTREMVQYILSLADEKQVVPNMPLKGNLTTKAHVGKGEEGTYFLSMAYTDKGANGISPLTSRKLITLQYPRLQAEAYDKGSNVAKQGTRENTAFVTRIKDGAYIAFDDLDLTNVAKLTFAVNPRQEGTTIEIRLDGPKGKIIGSAALPAIDKTKPWNEISAAIEKTTGKHSIYFVITHQQIKDKDLLDLDWIFFHQELQSLPASHSKASAR